MSSKKKSTDYAAAAKELRRLKLLPDHYDLRKLGESEKRHIRRLNQQNADIVGKDYIKPVKLPKAQLDKLAGKGIRINKKKYLGYVEAWGAKSVKWDKRDDSLVFQMLRRNYRAYPLDDSVKTYERINSFFENRKKQQYMTFKIGNGNMFYRKIVTEEDFYKYLEQFKPKDDDAWNYMMIVEVRPGK